MKNNILLLMLCVILMISGVSFAEDEQDLVVLLVIDQSGSMVETDPQDYRLASAAMMVDILGQQDQLGILTFSSEVSRLHELTPLGDNRQTYHDALAKTGTPEGNTDYLLALQEARTILREANVSQSAVVFLTDGDPHPNARADDEEYMAEYLAELDQLVEQLALENCAVYTVGFGNSSGEILEPISTTTHGLSFINTRPQELAGHFFSIVSSLKGRDVMVEETLSNQAQSYRFELDANTTQLNGLVLGQFTGQMPYIMGPGGNRIAGKPGEGYVSFVLTEQELSRQGSWALEVPKANSRVMVARDTKIRLEILSPTIQSEFSEQAPIDLALRVHGSDQELTLDVRPLLNGEPQTDWQPLTFRDDLYRGQLTELTSSGNVAVEFRARSEETILTRQQVPVRIKRIPELHVELVTGQKALVGESDVTINAWLTRNQQTLTPDRVVIEEFRWVGGSPDQEISLIELRDDGQGGDLIEGDGIYSARLKLNRSGKLEGEIQARGIYGQESFQLTRILEDFTIEEPGTVELMLNNNQSDFEDVFQSQIQVPFVLDNQATYPETVTVTTDDPGITITNPLFRLEPGQRLETVLQLQIEDQTSPNMDLKFNYSVTNTGTNISQPISRLSLIRKSTSQVRRESLSQLFTRFGPIILGLILLGSLGLLITRMLKRKKARAVTMLKGYLHYRQTDAGWQSIPLEGSEVQIAIGKVQTPVDHSLPGRELGFVLAIKRQPAAISPDDITFQLHCGLPGVIKISNLETSTVDVKYGDRFLCGGYECMILDKPSN